MIINSFVSNNITKIGKDNINIHSWFTLNTETNEVSVKCKVAKNWLTKEEQIFEGSAKECLEFISNL